MIVVICAPATVQDVGVVDVAYIFDIIGVELFTRWWGPWAPGVPGVLGLLRGPWAPTVTLMGGTLTPPASTRPSDLVHTKIPLCLITFHLGPALGG